MFLIFPFTGLKWLKIYVTIYELTANPKGMDPPPDACYSKRWPVADQLCGKLSDFGSRGTREDIS